MLAVGIKIVLGLLLLVCMYCLALACMVLAGVAAMLIVYWCCFKAGICLEWDTCALIISCVALLYYAAIAYIERDHYLSWKLLKKLLNADPPLDELLKYLSNRDPPRDPPDGGTQGEASGSGGKGDRAK